MFTLKRCVIPGVQKKKKEYVWSGANPKKKKKQLIWGQNYMK